MSNLYFSDIPEITVETLAARLTDLSETCQLLDVRESQELDISTLEGFQHWPLSRFGQWSTQIHTLLDPHQETIVLCHHGLRSAQMCQWLLREGFTNVMNVAGGIDAYAVRIDPSLMRY